MQPDNFANKDSLIEELENYRQEFVNIHRKWFPSCQDDQIQDAYTDGVIIFYSNVKSGKLQTLDAPVKSYVFAVAKNLLRNEQRKSSKYLPLTTDFSSEDETQEREAKKDLERKEQILHEALRELGPRAQQLLTLLLVQGLKIADIAKVMHFSSVRSASTAKHKFIVKLKRLVAKKYKEWEWNDTEP